MPTERRSTNSATPSSSAPHTARYRPMIHRMRRPDSDTALGSGGGSKGGIAGAGGINCSRSALRTLTVRTRESVAGDRLRFGAWQEHAAASAADHRLCARGGGFTGALLSCARIALVDDAQCEQHDEDEHQPGDYLR